ncbi:helix-turn-helix domain-containing protein [Nakamurella sp. GG22]
MRFNPARFSRRAATIRADSPNSARIPAFTDCAAGSPARRRRARHPHRRHLHENGRRRRESAQRRWAGPLLQEESPQAVTAAEVASRAGVAVGTLYGRFGDNPGLLRAVHRAEVENINITVLAGLAALRNDQTLLPDQVVNGAVRAILRVFRERFKVERELRRSWPCQAGCRSRRARRTGSSVASGIRSPWGLIRRPGVDRHDEGALPETVGVVPCSDV